VPGSPFQLRELSIGHLVAAAELVLHRSGLAAVAELAPHHSGQEAAVEPVPHRLPS